jgi:glutathionyl-hydroquinone reductase
MKRLMGLALGFLLLFGCAGKGYWMVNDPHTKNVYYTQKLNLLASGTVSFTDAKTGKMVNLQSSEIMKMTEDEFKAALANAEKK